MKSPGKTRLLVVSFAVLASGVVWVGSIHAAAANLAPVLAQPGNMTVCEGGTGDQVLNATDPDGDPIAFSLVSGPTFVTVSTTSSGTGTATGNVHLATGFNDGGTYPVTVRASDGSLNNDKSFTISVVSAAPPPTLSQPADMTVDEGATADQTLHGSEAFCASPLTFSKVAGPTFVTVTTTNATSGNVHLAPNLSEAGTYSVTIRVSDPSDGLTDSKSFTITVNNVNQAPVLAQPANMTVQQGATADQSIAATDPDGQPLTFAKVTGPTFMTVTTVTPGSGTGTGNIHLAPGITEPFGTASATVSSTDGTLTDSKPLVITVGQCHDNPVLAQPANMTVHAGSTADQGITGTDACGSPLTFTKVAGPTFMTVFTTNPGTGTGIGDIHLAPGLVDVGSYSATVRVSDGAQSDDKSFAIQVNPSGGGAPTLAQPADMTVTEGVTADQTLSASDPDGDPLTFAKESGPFFMTVFDLTPPTGDLHLAPGFADAGIYRASVRASDGISSDAKSLTITVN